MIFRRHYDATVLQGGDLRLRLILEATNSEFHQFGSMCVPFKAYRDEKPRALKERGPFLPNPESAARI